MHINRKYGEKGWACSVVVFSACKEDGWVGAVLNIPLITPSVQIMGWREAGDEWLCLPGHMDWTWAFIKPGNVAQMKVTPRDVSPADFAPLKLFQFCCSNAYSSNGCHSARMDRSRVGKGCLSS